MRTKADIRRQFRGDRYIRGRREHEAASHPALGGLELKKKASREGTPPLFDAGPESAARFMIRRRSA